MAKNSDDVDQCIVWWCTNDREYTAALHCRAHRGFARVNLEATDGK